MTRAKRVREPLAVLAVAVAACVLPAACRGSNAQQNDTASDNTAKASRSSAAPSVRGGDSEVSAAHQVLFIGTSLTAGLGLNPDSAYPQLIQQKIDSAKLP